MNSSIKKIISACQKQNNKLKVDASIGVSDYKPYNGSNVSLSQEVGWQISEFNFPEIWSQTKGKNVKVAVLDTGVDVSHPDLEITKSIDFVGIRNANWWDSVNQKVIAPDIDYNTYTVS